MPALNNRWAVLGLLFLARIAMPLQFQSLPPVSNMLMAELGLTLAQFGFLMGMFMFPGVFIALPAGMLGSRFGDKQVVLAGLGILASSGLLFAIGDTFTMVFTARLLGGVGLVLLNVQLTKIATDWFAGRELSTAMGLLMSSWTMGTGLAFTILGFIATESGWRMAVGVPGVYAAVGLLIMAIMYRESASPAWKPGITESSIPTRPRLWVITRRELGLVAMTGICWALFNASIATFLGFTPGWLISKGMGVASASLVTGLISWIGVASVPLGGWLADRTGRINLLIVGSALGSGLTIWGMVTYSSSSPLVWILLLGVVYGPLPGCIMSLPGQVLSPEGRSTGLGVYYTVYSMGTAVFLPIAGRMGDLSDNPATPVLFAGLLIAAIAPALLAFRWVQCRWDRGMG